MSLRMFSFRQRDLPRDEDIKVPLYLSADDTRFFHHILNYHEPGTRVENNTSHIFFRKFGLKFWTKIKFKVQNYFPSTKFEKWGIKFQTLPRTISYND